MYTFGSVGLWVGVGALAVGCGGFSSGACEDPDAQGRCDVPCEGEACDTDGGSASVDDGCPPGPIGPDEEVPGGCDPCAGLEGGDQDGDGVCDAHDPCPVDADDDCAEMLFFAMQVDGFARGAGWSVTGPLGEEIAERGFRGAGDGIVQRLEVPVRGVSCLRLEVEAGRRGGIRGQIFSRRRNVLFEAWDYYDWRTRSTTFCFQPAEDGAYVPEGFPDREAFLSEGVLCDVSVSFFTGSYAEEHAWRLLREDDAYMAGFEGAWTGGGAQYTDADNRSTDERTYALVPGGYQIEMIDRFGDGWQGDPSFPDDAEIRVRVEGTEVVQDHLAASECGGSVECRRAASFTVACE